MAKVAKAEVETRLHTDGAVSHKFTFANGDSRTVLIRANHPLAQHFVAHGSKAKYLAAINSVDTTEKAIAKVDELDEAHNPSDAAVAPKWSLQSEGNGKSKAGALVQALAKLKGVSEEEADAYAKTLTRAEQAKLRAHPEVARVILEIEAADRVKDGDDLLGGFLAPAKSDEAAA